MKTILLGLSFMSFIFSTNSFNSSENIDNAICVEDNTEEFVRVTCFKTVNGVTYSASAGNFLSSAEGAARRCEAKLP